MIGGANGERKEAKMDHGACRSLCVRYGISAALPQALGTELPSAQWLEMHLNLTPLRTVRRFIWVLTHSRNPRLLRQAFMNLYGNIFLFLPLGLFPPLLWARMRKLWNTALLATGIMVCVEVLQMLLLVGTCDIDDVMLNVLGASMGYGVYKLLARMDTKEK